MPLSLPYTGEAWPVPPPVVRPRDSSGGRGDAPGVRGPKRGWGEDPCRRLGQSQSFLQSESSESSESSGAAPLPGEDGDLGHTGQALRHAMLSWRESELMLNRWNEQRAI